MNNRISQYKKPIKVIFQLLFISAICIFSKESELILLIGTVLILFGYWWKWRIFGACEGSAYSMEHVFNLQNKIKNNQIDGLTKEIKDSILNMKGTWWSHDSALSSEDKPTNKELDVLQSLKLSIYVREICIKTGLILVVIALTLYMFTFIKSFY